MLNRSLMLILFVLYIGVTPALINNNISESFLEGSRWTLAYTLILEDDTVRFDGKEYISKYKMIQGNMMGPDFIFNKNHILFILTPQGEKKLSYWHLRSDTLAVESINEDRKQVCKYMVSYDSLKKTLMLSTIELPITKYALVKKNDE